jgi:hypothetical protein
MFRVLVGLALGLGCFSLGMLLLGTVGLIEPGVLARKDGETWVPALLLLIAAGAGFLPTRSFLQTFNRVPFRKRIGRGEWMILLAAVPIAIMCIAATYPPGTLWGSEGLGYDVREYHLQLPREYAAANSTAPLGHNVYSWFPANVEMLYLLAMQLAKFAMRGGGGGIGGILGTSHLWGVYPAQVLHVSLMLAAIASIAVAPLRIGTIARVVAMLLLVSIPWTIVTGSLAYNEGGMLLFGILALGLALGPSENASGARALLIGILLGLAVGCKMTAGVFFALPVAAVLIWRGIVHAQTQKKKWRHAIGRLTIATAAAAVIYAPWAIRAAIYSGGNPVFPLATRWLPKDDWTPQQTDRFDRGHTALIANQPVRLFDIPARTAALARQSVMDAQWSPGWASIYEWAGEKPDDAWWKHVGILWIIAPLAVVLAILSGLRQRPGEGPHDAPPSISLLIALGVQALAWLFLTHLQSRFLLPAAVPLSLLVGIGAAGLGEGVGGLAIGALRIIICAVVAVQALCCAFLLLPEASLFGGSVARGNAPPRPQPIGQLFERRWNWALFIEGSQGREIPLNREPPLEKTLLVGDAAPLFQEGPIVYSTVFDKNPLGEALRRGGPEAAFRWLRADGIRYVVIDWSEIKRLRDTYGFDSAITPEAIKALEEIGLEQVPVDWPPHTPAPTILRVPPIATHNAQPSPQ